MEFKRLKIYNKTKVITEYFDHLRRAFAAERASKTWLWINGILRKRERTSYKQRRPSYRQIYQIHDLDVVREVIEFLDKRADGKYPAQFSTGSTAMEYSSLYQK